MSKIKGKLTQQQLSHYIGSECYFNNGKNVLRGPLTNLILSNYRDDGSGPCLAIYPLLRKMENITPEQGMYISKQPYYSDGFALSFIKKVTDGYHRFHAFTAEWYATDVYIDFMSLGIDAFDWIGRGKAIDIDQDDLAKSYSINEFEAFFL